MKAKSNHTTPASDIAVETFPVLTRKASGDVGGVLTELLFVTFADKLLFTICQNGRLAHWVHVPLDNATADQSMIPLTSSNYEDGEDEVEDEVDAESNLLPLSHLTASTILGGTLPGMNTIGQLCATQIASAVLARNPEERRLLVVGLGLQNVITDRSAFFDLVELVMKCMD